MEKDRVWKEEGQQRGTGRSSLSEAAKYGEWGMNYKYM